jgi:UDP-N-acetylmuramoylalanine--D-glutamate ligase
VVIDISTRKNQTIVVLGLGGSGLMAARALKHSGAQIIAWDDNPDQRSRAEKDGITTVDLDGYDFSDTDALVLAPGIPFTYKPHKLVAKARATTVAIIGDIELLVEACPQARFVGITGTNGKSTTTALLGHLLQQAGVKAQIGGNLGPPALGLAPPEPGEAMVLELSSYQLDLTERACFDIAVLLNISPDHLDRHGDMAGYIAAKKRLFRDHASAAKQIAVIGIDDTHSRAVYEDIAGRTGWTTIPISAADRPADGVYVADGILIDDQNGDAKPVVDLSSIVTLTGRHNWQNAAAAYAAACALGLDSTLIATAFESYPGLPHRLELVAMIDGVRYINDSKATNGEAAAVALACFGSIYWIAGGQAKEDGLTPTLNALGGVHAAFLIGEAQDSFFEQLQDRIPVTKCGDLASAIALAKKQAEKDGARDAVILLSPAAASFDQWPNFKARGDGFRALVQAPTAETRA